ncbi:MAG: hypothetical protein ACYDGN_17460 [Acidimicrobiales bacterium]
MRSRPRKQRDGNLSVTLVLDAGALAALDQDLACLAGELLAAPDLSDVVDAALAALAVDMGRRLPPVP